MGISKQATEDGVLVAVLQDANSTQREKQKAFDELYSRHQKQVGIYFLKQLRDEDTAEDLKMITFEKVHENIGKYNAKSAVFSTWMYKIALNTLIDHKRKDKFEVLSLDALTGKTSEDNDGMDFQIVSDAITPEQVMVRDQNIKAVRDAIASIENDKIRQLMTYRFIDELFFPEIAKLKGMDKENSTLRVNAMRGQKLLKVILENQ